MKKLILGLFVLFLFGGSTSKREKVPSKSIRDVNKMVDEFTAKIDKLSISTQNFSKASTKKNDEK